jgi:nitroreductase
MTQATRLQKPHVLDIIKQRRSVGQVTQEEPTREQIEQLLEAATYAPNHHVTEPWRFFVLRGEARAELGGVFADTLKAQMQEPLCEKDQMKLLQTRNKWLRAPVLIAVAVEKVENDEDFMERIEAASAAVQNMLLTAQEMGLATVWRTGGPSYSSEVKQWLGLASEDHIVAFVYLGFPKITCQPRTPTHFSQKTTWLG